jgi:hypothetical protein
MELPNELRYSMPRDVNVNRISQHVKLPCGLASPLGETHLFSCDGRLIILSRNKPNEEFRPLDIPAQRLPKLLHEEWQDILVVRGAGNQKWRIPLPNCDVGPVSFLLNEVKADGERISTADAEGHSLDQPPDDAASGESPNPASLPAVDLSDPESLRAGIRDAVAIGQFGQAETWMRALTELSQLYTPECEDLGRVIDALRRQQPAEAFLRAELSDLGLMGAKDGVLSQVSLAFEKAEEPIWAAAALLGQVAPSDEPRLARLFRAVERDARREEHHDWLLSEFEQKRSAHVSERILATRTDPLWRELRARLAGRRGGHGLALRELKILSERFPGTVTIETARLRTLWESGQRAGFERLLQRCITDFSDSPRNLIRIGRLVEDLGAPPLWAAELFAFLLKQLPDDRPLTRWLNGFDMKSGGSNGGLVWVGGAAAAVALGAGALLLLT